MSIPTKPSQLPTIDAPDVFVTARTADNRYGTMPYGQLPGIDEAVAATAENREAAEQAAAIAQATSGAGLPTRAALVEAVAAGYLDTLSDGQVVVAEGYPYRKASGETAIADLPGWLPYGIPSIKHFGGVGDGVTNDLAKENAAHQWATGLSRPLAIHYPNQRFLGFQSVDNIYGPGVFNNGMAARYMAGTGDYPTTSGEAVLMVNKFSETDSNWDSGAIYGSLRRLGGDGFGGVAVTGVAEFVDGEGDLVAIHGRGKVLAAGNKGAWGGWFWAEDTEDGSRHLIGAEINIIKKGPDAGWQSTPTVANTSRGIAVTTESNVNSPGTMAIYVGGRPDENAQSRWYTGFMNRQDSIMPTDTAADAGIGNGEVFRLQGGSVYDNRYGGIRFEKGQFQYGISFVEGTYAGNVAILLGANQRISFGSNSGAIRRISWDGTSLLNVTEMDIGRNGVRLLTTRRTGWTAATGTATRTTFVTSSVTLEQLAQRVKALIDDLMTHGLIGE